MIENGWSFVKRNKYNLLTLWLLSLSPLILTLRFYLLEPKITLFKMLAFILYIASAGIWTNTNFYISILFVIFVYLFSFMSIDSRDAHTFLYVCKLFELHVLKID